MLLQSWVRELIDGFISFVASVLNRLRNVLNELIDLLLICRRGLGLGTDEGDQWLNALDKQSSLVLKVVLQASISRSC